VAALAAALSAARAQDEKPDPKAEATKRLLEKAQDEYRTFIRRPDTVIEYWAAMKFEIQLGKFDLAALHLKQLLAKEPAEKANRELFKIEAAEGLSTFLNLRKIKKWSDFPEFDKEAKENVEKLIDRVIEATRQALSDPERINKFIKRLDAPTPEERAFAFDQLYRSKAQAVPYLIDALRANSDNSLGVRIQHALLRLDSSVVPAFLEALRAVDAKDAGSEVPLRMTLLDVVQKRADKRAIPYLWHLSAWEKYPPLVRGKARQVLAKLTATDPQYLPPSYLALTQLAQDYYHHRVRFPAGQPIRVWPWDGQKIETKPVDLTPHQAEEFFGLRYARQALQLDKAYRPAQVAFLSLSIERALEPKLDQAALEPLPANLQNLLVRIDPELLMRVLEHALDDHNVPVILGSVAALGERGEFRAARLNSGGQPRGLVRALYYPDRRVQLAAALAMLKMPTAETPVAADRVVNIFRRLLAGDAVPKALVAYAAMDRAAEVRKGVKAAGYDAVLVGDVKQAFEKLHESADYDLVVLARGLPPGQMPFVLNQLRSDFDAGELPVFLIASKDTEDDLARIAKKYRHVHVLPEGYLPMGDEMKKAVDEAVTADVRAKLTPEERKQFARVALDKLWRMARGEIRGYDVRPAQDALLAAVRSPEPDVALQALEAYGRIPGRPVQARLASLLADPTKPKLRVPAGMELNRHIQKYGLLLDPRTDRKLVKDLRDAYETTKGDPDLRGQIAVALGVLRPELPRTGEQLIEFDPFAQPAAAPMPKEKEKKEKEG
jgi:CheY-like chemotaxis protein